MASLLPATAAFVLLAATLGLTHALSDPIISFHIPEAPASPEDNTVVFDDSPGLDRVFEGIGAISGGGATSKLLVNYPQKQRDEILDYLFKPNFGASLQIFKVEIGGDMQSTDGTEASHMHDKYDENYSRGYEWWLMREAKKRNPDIKLYALPWGFPGWIGGSTNDPYSDPKRTADYVIRWINGAKHAYGLDIDYVGIWNEKHYNITYIKTLRQMLNDTGYEKTLIIANDNKWAISQDILKDEDLASAVHAIGCHYPGTFSDDASKYTMKPLWSSEDYSTFNDEIGGGCWARILNQNYVNGLMTSTISWNLIGSYYPKLPFFRDGLMTAAQPWSGHYNVSTPIWISAHTTQFVPIGWKYLSHDSGVGKLPHGGSYVSLTNEARDQLTIVIETMTHAHSACIRPKLPPYHVHPQNITVHLKGSFGKINKMNVWYSKLGFDGEKNQMFLKRDPLVFTDGKADLSLGLDETFTLTTVDTGNKGSHPEPPKPSPFPQVIADTFDSYDEHVEPYYLAPQVGSLEVRNIQGRKVARQVVTEKPVNWCPAEKANKTLTILGDYDWSEMNVSVSFNIPEDGGTNGVFVAARVSKGGCKSQIAKGVFFYVFPKLGKYIVTKDFARTKNLTHGSIPSTNGWHRISVEISGGKATGSFDYQPLFSVNVPKKPVTGWAGIGTDNYGLADFDDFMLRGPQAIRHNY